MATQSKLELLMELSDNLFNNKLSQVQAKLSSATDKMEGKLKHFNMTQIKIFSGIGEAFDPVKINQAAELFEKLESKLDFTKDINNTKTALGQMGVENIDEMAAKVHKLGKVWGDSDDEIAKSANALTKQLGGSFDSNLAILQAGYEKGANLNGDMLDQFKEYTPQIKELGLNASQMLAIMADAGKKGVFSDSAIDAIQEANLSLKEMGPAQLAALQGIGLGVKDLAGKTSFEVVQLISKAMNTATSQAKQLALADIFKGAGERAGMGYILGLGSVDLDPTKLQNFKNSDEKLKGWIADIESFVSDKVGGMMPYLSSIGMAAFGISSVIGLIKTLTEVQWLSNLAAAASPYALVALAIGAVIGVVVLAIKYFDDLGALFLFLLGPIGRIIVAFKLIYDHWDSIVKAFQGEGILGGLARIGEVLMDVILKPLQQILELIAKFDPTGLAQKGADAVKDFRSGHKLVTEGETTTGNLNVNNPTDPLFLKGIPATGAFANPALSTPKNPLSKAPVIDGKLATTGKKDKKTGENISKVTGQANQVRNTTIQVDAFNKGGINVAQSAYAGMSKEDIEAWFKEMLRRIVINAETT